MDPQPATSAPRAPVRSARPARRTHYPDGSPQSVFGQPAFRLQSEPARKPESFRILPIHREPALDREPDDQVTHRAECCYADGQVFHQSREPGRYQCDCAEFAATRWGCVHLTRLVELGFFPELEPAGRWTLAGKGGQP